MVPFDKPSKYVSDDPALQRFTDDNFRYFHIHVTYSLPTRYTYNIPRIGINNQACKRDRCMNPPTLCDREIIFKTTPPQAAPTLARAASTHSSLYPFANVVVVVRNLPSCGKPAQAAPHNLPIYNVLQSQDGWKWPSAKKVFRTFYLYTVYGGVAILFVMSANGGTFNF